MKGNNTPYSAEALLRVGWRRRWQIVLPAVVIAAAASWWVHRLPDRYRAEATLLIVPHRAPETFVRSTMTTRTEQRLQSISQQILSRTELERIVREFDLYAGPRKTDSMQEIVDGMRARDIEIRPVKGDAFRLWFSAGDPDVARRVAERLVSLFVVQASLDRATLAEGADQFLEAQLEDARRKLVDNETQLAEYRRRHAGELPTQIEANVQGLRDTRMQMQLLVDSLGRDRDRQLILERSLKDAKLGELVESRAPAASGNAPRLTAADDLARAEATLKEMQSSLTEQHPDVVAMKHKIAELRKRADLEIATRAESLDADMARRNRLEGLRAELSALERRIAEQAAETERLRGALVEYQRRIEQAPTREVELAALTRDYDTLQQNYRGLLAKKQESAIAANLERQPIGAQFRVLDPPRLPEEPFAPKRLRLYALAVLGGLAAGILLAFVLEWCGRGLRTEEDVRLALGLPVLAIVPVVSRGRWGGSR
jgi:polysaccharide chain length determinant protein (PEP-CTERM system associated)